MDTLLILYGSEIHKDGTNIHIYASDTDVFILALATMAQLGDEATVIMGKGVNCRRVRLHPIYHALGQRRVSALKGFHALSGCDSTGRIFGKSNDAWWNIFEKASEEILIALAELGTGVTNVQFVYPNGFCKF